MVGKLEYAFTSKESVDFILFMVGIFEYAYTCNKSVHYMPEVSEKNPLQAACLFIKPLSHNKIDNRSEVAEVTAMLYKK